MEVRFDIIVIWTLLQFHHFNSRSSMVESDLHFSHVSFDEAGSYKLIELTADLNALVEGALQVDAGLKYVFDQAIDWLTPGSLHRLTIKGHSSEDAVLCTQNKTFSMRSVSLSNTVLVVTPVPDERAADFSDDAIIVRDQLNEIVELVPVVPRLHKLTALIRERQYDETQEAETQLGDPHDGDVVGPRYIQTTAILMRLLDPFHVPRCTATNPVK